MGTLSAVIAGMPSLRQQHAPAPSQAVLKAAAPWPAKLKISMAATSRHMEGLRFKSARSLFGMVISWLQDSCASVKTGAEGLRPDLLRSIVLALNGQLPAQLSVPALKNPRTAPYNTRGFFNARRL
jgi:hypothetical protein